MAPLFAGPGVLDAFQQEIESAMAGGLQGRDAGAQRCVPGVGILQSRAQGRRTLLGSGRRGYQQIGDAQILVKRRHLRKIVHADARDAGGAHHQGAVVTHGKPRTGALQKGGEGQKVVAVILNGALRLAGCGGDHLIGKGPVAGI